MTFLLKNESNKTREIWIHYGINSILKKYDLVNVYLSECTYKKNQEIVKKIIRIC